MEQKRIESRVDAAVLFCFCAAVFFTPVSISFATVFAYLALAVSLFSGRLFKGLPRLPRREWFYPVLALVVMPWVGLLYSDDAATGLKLAKKTHYWLLALAALPLSLNRFSMKALLNAFLLGLSLTAVVYVLQFAGVVPHYEYNKLGFIHHITYSLFLVFGMLLLSFYLRGLKEFRPRVLVGLLLLLLFFNLLIVEGRTGYVAFILLSPLMIYNIIGRRHVLKAAVACVLIVGAMFFSPVVRERVRAGINDIELYRTGDAFTSLGTRFYLWERTFSMFRENPLIGVGTGGIRPRMKEGATPPMSDIEFTHAHNSYLYMAASYGIPGLAVLLWFFAVLLRAGWRGRGSIHGYAVLCYALVMISGSLSDTQIIQGQSAMLLAVFTGLTAAYE
jgi:O-antigen ligase